MPPMFYDESAEKWIPIEDHIKNEIESVRHDGYEAMVSEVAALIHAGGDYSASAEAQEELIKIKTEREILFLKCQKIERDLLNDKEESNMMRLTLKTQELQNKSAQEIKSMWLDAAKLYIDDGKLVEAARIFEKQGEEKRALKLYVQDGSENAKHRALQLALYRGVNPNLGLKLLVELREFFPAFEYVNDMTKCIGHSTKDSQIKNWFAYLVQGMYDAAVIEMKESIKQQAGKKNIRTKSLAELVHTHPETEVSKSLKYAVFSIFEMTDGLYSRIKNEKTRAMIAELLEYSIKGQQKNTEFSDAYFRILSKLTNAESAITYFRQRAEIAKQNGDYYNTAMMARKAIQILGTQNRLEELGNISDEYLDPSEPDRQAISKKFGVAGFMKLGESFRKKAENERNHCSPLEYAALVDKIKHPYTKK